MYAIVSDIHGNLEALTAVLADIQSRGIETIYCLGDVVGYGPNPRECVDQVRNFEICILGNHDNGALFDPDGFSAGAEKAIFWTRQQLEAIDSTDGESDEETPASQRWNFLAGLPRTWRRDGWLYVHGSPRSPLNEYVFPEDVGNFRKLERIFAFIQKYCFQGHTHVPGVFTENSRFHSPDELPDGYELGDEKVMVNVGSVGQPRDGDPRACYVTVDDLHVRFHRLDYPRETTREKIYAITELDNFLGDRLLEGR